MTAGAQLWPLRGRSDKPNATGASLGAPLRFLCILTLGLYIAAAALIASHSKNGLDPAGSPVGYDFSAYYEAASFAKSGKAAAAYDDTTMIAAEQARFPGIKTRLPWNYPPLFQLLLLPLAGLPYLAAWAVWLAFLLSGYVWLTRQLTPGPTFFPLLLFPGAAINLFLGANGLLSALLLGAGLVLLRQRPLAAGLILALTAYKPHLALLIPFALLAGRHYRALGAMTVGLVALVALSGFAFGPDCWPAFIEKSLHASAVAHASSSDWHRIPTVLTLGELLGLAPLHAMLLQGLASVAALLSVAWIWRRSDDFGMKSGALALALLIATPYARIYDLSLLVLPLAALAHRQVKGPNLVRRIAIASAWMAPLSGLLVPPLIPYLALFHLALLVLVMTAAREGQAASPRSQNRTAAQTG